MVEKAQSTIGGTQGPPTRGPLKKQDSDRDFDDYFVSSNEEAKQ
jgi:hypothetical protein